MTEEREQARWQDVVLDAWRQGQALSAVGPGSVEIHLRLARGLADVIGDEPTVGLDLGTGAGIPGLAVAGFLPRMAWTLLDAARRRTALLERVVEELGWERRVTVVHARAEAWARDPSVARSFSVVTVRSFGPPAVAAECAAPLVAPGGRILVTEPPVAGPGRWPPEHLRPLGLELGPRHADPAVQELVAVGPPEARFPRKPGIAAKRPLW